MTAAQSLPSKPPHLGPVVDDAAHRARFEALELATVMSHFDIGTIRQIQVCPLGSRQSPKVQIATDGGQYLLKRRAPGRDDPERVSFAHGLMQQLHRWAYPVPALILTRDHQRSGLSHEGRIYELFEFVIGTRCERTATDTTSAGAMLGRMHDLLAEYVPRHRPPEGSYHAAAEVDNCLDRIVAAVAAVEPEVDRETLGGTVEALRESYRTAGEQVEMLGFGDWTPLILHGDWHPGNLIVRDGTVVGVLDFDSARLEPRIVDVANGALQFSMLMGRADDPGQWPEGLDPQRIRAFLGGYDSATQRPLNEQELAALPWLIVEALVVESIVPIAAHGMFGRVRGSDFLGMVQRKVDWLGTRMDRMLEYLQGEG